MGFFDTLGEILCKVASSAAASSGRTIDRSMKSGKWTDEQRERMRTKRDEMRKIHDDYVESEKEKQRAKEEAERNNY